MNRLPSTIFSFALAMGLLLFSFFTKLSSLPVRIWDEARNAVNAVHMHLHGNWLIPYFEGAPDMWNTKPPLLIWMQVACMKILGINEWALRLPAAMAALLTGLLLWKFCKKYLSNAWIGFGAAAVLATTFAYVDNHAGRTGDYDAPLVLFITAYCFTMFAWIMHGKKKLIYCFFIFLTLAVLTKGIAGLTLLPGIALLLLVKKKLPALLRYKHFYGGSLLCIFVIGSYYILREQLNPGYLRAVYDNELGGRFLQTLEDHKHPFNYYVEAMRDHAYGYWAYPAILSFTAPLLLQAPIVRSITLFNALMVFPFLLIVSLGQTKLEWYVLPVYPFLAIQIALAVYGLLWQLSTMLPILAKPAFVAIFITMALLYPLQAVAQHIYHYKEKPWDVEEHKLTYYLQWAANTGQPMDGYTVAYSGYNAHISFYVQKLQAAGTSIRLQPHVDNLLPGQHVVLSERDLATRLTGAYRLQRTGEKFGCTVYLVQSR